jgi:hypothetical protein
MERLKLKLQILFPPRLLISKIDPLQKNSLRFQISQVERVEFHLAPELTIDDPSLDPRWMMPVVDVGGIVTKELELVFER